MNAYEAMVADPVAWWASWIEEIAAGIADRVVTAAHKVDPSRNGHYFHGGRPLTDREFDAVRYADRLLCAVAKVPGVDTRGCDACSRTLSDYATEMAENAVLGSFVRHAEEGLAFCPFCQLQYDELAAHAATAPDRILVNARRRPAAVGYQAEFTLAEIDAEIERRGLTTEIAS